MAVRMAASGRSRNGEFFARKGIPADVRETYPAQTIALPRVIPARIVGWYLNTGSNDAECFLRKHSICANV